jgi:hypothetical protein
MSELLRLTGRGAVAGLAGGTLCAAVGFVLGEPWVQRAIALEEAAAHADGGSEHAEVFSRAAQQGGLAATAVLTGLAVGVLFGVVYALWHRADPDADPWRRGIRLGLMGFAGVGLIPFLRYPANPPAVGDPATVDARTSAYLLAILVGLLTVTAAWQVFARLVERGAAESTSRLAATAVLLAGAAATMLLPANTDPLDAPADLIWAFRLAALASLAALWLGTGAAFGLLGEPAARAGTRTGVSTSAGAR